MGFIKKHISMNYPDNIRTKKAKVFYWFFKRLYVFEQGKGQVVGRLMSWFQEFALFILLIKSYGVNPSFFMLSMIMLVAFIICYTIGHYYLSSNADRVSSQISQERNILLTDIHSTISKDKVEKL